MKHVGITGINGFIGKHLANRIHIFKEEFELVNYENSCFNDESKLFAFIEKSDVIVHLAGLNRHNSENTIYHTNIELVKKIKKGLERKKQKTHVLFASSTLEQNDSFYGKSKKEGRLLLSEWANTTNNIFTGLILPNVFGPHGKPFYNSVVATFCHQLVYEEIPKIENNSELNLLYIDDLTNLILEIIRKNENNHEFIIKQTVPIKVDTLLNILSGFYDSYIKKQEIPFLQNEFEKKLFITFLSFRNLEKSYPIEVRKQQDERGFFSEIIRTNISGQISFSVTNPGVTRGNHFHTRKMERFIIIKGEAELLLRRIGTDLVYKHQISSEKIVILDIPVWHTHSLRNTGTDELYTIFWINELYDSSDSDTYFENVILK